MARRKIDAQKKSGEVPCVERRASIRFPIQQPVNYFVPDAKRAFIRGTGVTINMSSAGVLFSGDIPVGQGEHLDMSVDWPVRLENGCPLKLVILGRVVRTHGNQMAIQIDKQELRTRGTSALNPS